jgi:DNA-binding transcriptional LysR family regulator
MLDFRELRPILNSLPVFITTAQHLSFTAAATDLRMTQPAVSYCIKQIENSLQVKLFHREHRSLTMTAAGKKLFADVSVGLGRIRQF